ncbi:MAG: 50S ribosomal protein L4 [Clostridia bacterium]|nr:50S ribosomal protein L4 [Clostridia bacterium]
MKLNVLDINGKANGTIEVSDEIFGAEYNEALIHQVVVAQLANKRQGTKSTLTRTEVRGGGIKPWRQKGTGRARQGSIRAPQWRHGGVVFAPKPRDFSKKINKKMRTQAFKSAISQKLRQDELFVVDKLELAEAKTRLMAKVCEGLDAGKKALFVIAGENENVVRATKNLADAAVTGADILSVYDLVAANKVYLTVDAIKAIEEVNA